MTKVKDAMKEAIKRAGSNKALAHDIGVSPSMITRYKKENTRVPADRAVRIEKATGVSREDIRPDIFGR